MVQRPRRRLLGRHVVGRAGDDPGARQPTERGAPQQLDQPEVQDLHTRSPSGPPPCFEDHHVLGLQIPMDDALQVCFGEGVQDPEHDVHQLSGGQSTLTEQLVEGRALYILLHHEQRAILLDAEVVEAHDGLMVQRRDGLCLAHEPFLGFLCLEVPPWQDHLDGHGAVDHVLDRPVDGPHPALPQQAEDRVLAPQARAQEAIPGRLGVLALRDQIAGLAADRAGGLVHGLGPVVAVMADEDVLLHGSPARTVPPHAGLPRSFLRCLALRAKGLCPRAAPRVKVSRASVGSPSDRLDIPRLRQGSQPLPWRRRCLLGLCCRPEFGPRFAVFRPRPQPASGRRSKSRAMRDASGMHGVSALGGALAGVAPTRRGRTLDAEPSRCFTRCRGV